MLLVTESKGLFFFSGCRLWSVGFEAFGWCWKSQSRTSSSVPWQIGQGSTFAHMSITKRRSGCRAFSSIIPPYQLTEHYLTWWGSRDINLWKECQADAKSQSLMNKYIPIQYCLMVFGGRLHIACSATEEATSTKSNLGHLRGTKLESKKFKLNMYEIVKLYIRYLKCNKLNGMNIIDVQVTQVTQVTQNANDLQRLALLKSWSSLEKSRSWSRTSQYYTRNAGRTMFCNIITLLQMLKTPSPLTRYG